MFIFWAFRLKPSEWLTSDKFFIYTPLIVLKHRGVKIKGYSSTFLTHTSKMFLICATRAGVLLRQRERVAAPARAPVLRCISEEFRLSLVDLIQARNSNSINWQFYSHIEVNITVNMVVNRIFTNRGNAKDVGKVSGINSQK